MSRTIALTILVLCLGCAGGEPATDDDGVADSGEGGQLRSESHVFEEVADGVYFATGTGAVNLVSNAMVVVNDEDVLVVDSHITPDAAEGLIASVAAITDKPIRYLVNSHYHFDHAHGNQAFPEGIEIIGHTFTRTALLADPLAGWTYRNLGAPAAQQGLVDHLHGR